MNAAWWGPAHESLRRSQWLRSYAWVTPGRLRRDWETILDHVAPAASLSAELGRDAPRPSE